MPPFTKQIQKDMFSQFDVEEHGWPAQHADLNPIQDLWSKQDCEPDPTSVVDLTNALVSE